MLKFTKNFYKYDSFYVGFYLICFLFILFFMKKIKLKLMMFFLKKIKVIFFTIFTKNKAHENKTLYLKYTLCGLELSGI